MRHYTHPDLPIERAILADYFGLSIKEMTARRDAYIERTGELRAAAEALYELGWECMWARSYLVYPDISNEDRWAADALKEELAALRRTYIRQMYAIAIEVGFPERFAAHPLRPIN